MRIRKFRNWRQNLSYLRPFFFGSSDGFLELFDVQNDPNEVIIEFSIAE